MLFVGQIKCLLDMSILCRTGILPVGCKYCLYGKDIVCRANMLFVGQGYGL